MKRDNNWLHNRNQIKNPKMFNVTIFRDESGKLNLLGDQTLVCDRSKNQVNWTRVNTRAFGRLLNKQGVKFE
jgi:hypothetical protein